MSGPVVPEITPEAKPIEDAGSFNKPNPQTEEIAANYEEADVEARAKLHEEITGLGATPVASPEAIHDPIPEINTPPESPKTGEDSSWAKQINDERKEKSK